MMRPSEISFPDSKKDKICQISSTRHITVAVTNIKKLVYFVGDKFAKLIGVDNSSKYGFIELPVDKSDLFEKSETKAESDVDEVIAEEELTATPTLEHK